MTIALSKKRPCFLSRNRGVCVGVIALVLVSEFEQDQRAEGQQRCDLNTQGLSVVLCIVFAFCRGCIPDGLGTSHFQPRLSHTKLDCCCPHVMRYATRK